MKYSIFIFLAFFSLFISTTSCNKDDEPTPERVDSIKSVLPKQIIWKVLDQDSIIISIKYDTANHKIELYADDPSTSNLYDKLGSTYTYNNDGYLVNFSQADYDHAGNGKDTTFYNYQSVSNGVNITTTSDFGTVLYKYDNNYNLLQYQGATADDYSATFQNNANNSINKMLVTGFFEGTNESAFSYSSAIPDDKEDLLCRLLIGKDYYLWDLKKLYPFLFYLNIDYDNYMISATNPFHLTSMKDTHESNSDGISIEEATLTYELNSSKLLSKVTFKIGGEENGSVIFNY